MKLQLLLSYKDFRKNKGLYNDIVKLCDNIKNINLEYDGTKSDQFSVVTSSQIVDIRAYADYFIQPDLLAKYDKLSKNKQRKLLQLTLLSTFEHNKLVFDKSSMGKKFAEKVYETEDALSPYKLFKELQKSLIEKVTIDKATNQMTIK